jgi:hypothetical protein
MEGLHELVQVTYPLSKQTGKVGQSGRDGRCMGGKSIPWELPEVENLRRMTLFGTYRMQCSRVPTCKLPRDSLMV